MSLRRQLFLSHFLVTLLIVGGVGAYFYVRARDSMLDNLQIRLQHTAALVGETLDAHGLESLRTADDVRQPLYQETLAILRRLRSTNPDIAYLYIMRRHGDRVVFVVDSDETDGQAMPGRPYDLAPPALLAGFEAPSADQQITRDEWGAFLSGYAPLRNGRGRYLVGLDMRAREVDAQLRQLRLAGAAALLLSTLLALVFGRVLSARIAGPIGALIGQCRAVAAGRLEGTVGARGWGELQVLVEAFNLMSTRLRATRDQQLAAERALAQAKADLEQRVEERTSDLIRLNERLQAEIAERKRTEAALEHAAKTDYLTGLDNRRSMLEHLDHQGALFRRSEVSFAIVLLDIDRFKRINDSCGHDVGDAVLGAVARLFRDAVREQDLVSRWGGEEFLLLLPDTSVEGGRIVAEKIRVRVLQEIRPACPAVLPVTLSAGVSGIVPGMTVEAVIREADRGLYAAKAAGRNQVAVARDTKPA